MQRLRRKKCAARRSGALIRATVESVPPLRSLNASSFRNGSGRCETEPSFNPGTTMNDDPPKRRSKADADLEREIRADRTFSLEEAIGRMAGPGAMKGV